MDIKFTFPILILAISLQSSTLYSQVNFCVDVSLNLKSFKDEDTLWNFRYFKKGNCYFIWGTVYPAGTFDEHGLTSGMLPDSTPQFPDEVLGRFNSRGWVLQDEVTATEGRLALTKHILVMDKDFNGLKPFQLMTSGDEPVAADEIIYRAVNGGTDTMRTMKGEETMVYRGKNATGARNYTMCYSLDNMVDIVLSQQEVLPPQQTLAMLLVPNPSTGTVEISVDNVAGTGKGILRAFDMAGRMLWQQEMWLEVGMNRIEHHLDGLPNGMYRMHLTHGNVHIEKPLIINR